MVMCQIEENFVDKPETRKLNAADFGVYIRGLWIFAVRMRLETIPQEFCDRESIALRSNAKIGEVEDAVLLLGDLGYVNLNDDGSITVNGVAKHHARLTFTDVEEARTDLPETIPLILEDLPLFREDNRLLSKWNTLIASLKRTYPTIDVMAEVRSAHAWLECSGKRKKNYGQFLHNWIRRGLDRQKLYGQRPIERKRTVDDWKT